MRAEAIALFLVFFPGCGFLPGPEPTGPNKRIVRDLLDQWETAHHFSDGSFILDEPELGASCEFTSDFMAAVECSSGTSTLVELSGEVFASWNDLVPESEGRISLLIRADQTPPLDGRLVVIGYHDHGTEVPATCIGADGGHSVFSPLVFYVSQDDDNSRDALNRFLGEADDLSVIGTPDFDELERWEICE